MTQDNGINYRAIRLINILVCFASVFIGMFWGGVVFRERGVIVAGIGGFIVAVAWCFAMSRILRKGWNFLGIFTAAVVYGGIAGVIDGIALHAVCWLSEERFMTGSLAASILLGAIFGFVSGLANGGFWGLFYANIGKGKNK